MTFPVSLLHRTLLRARFLLWGRARLRRPVLERVAGLTLVVLPTVLNPRMFITGAFMAESLTEDHIPANGRVLDMGTGSGVVGLRAAALGANVVAIDLNPAAVRCARINALLNELETRFEARQGDLFLGLEGKRFDCVLFNPPYFRGEPRDELDRALRATDVVDRFAHELPRHLNEDGYSLLLWSDRADKAILRQAFPAAAYARREAASLATPSERFVMYRLEPIA